MKKNMLLSFQILTKIIIILLAISTFFIQHENPENYSNNLLVKLFSLDHYYNSPLNIALFSLMVILMIVAIFVRRLKAKDQIILHIIIALSFLVIIFDKSLNTHLMMPIFEGETINFGKIIGDDNYTQKIVLEKFDIEYHEDSNMPSAYTSTLKIDDNNPIQLNVNKPVKIGKYRLYQNAFDRIPVYNLNFEGSDFEIAIGDTLLVKNHTIFIDMKENRRSINFCFNEQQKTLSPMGGKFHINKFEFDLKMDNVAYVSIIEVASVKGMRMLLFLGLAFLAALGFAFWGKRS